MPASDLVGQVALVAGGGHGVGAAIARSLSARGVAVVVTGRDEHALARVVGEIAASGGKARHLAGDPEDPAHVRAAAEKAVSVFGGLQIVIVDASHSEDAGITLDDIRSAAHVATSKMTGAGRLIAITNDATNSKIVHMLRSLSTELASQKITCNTICAGWVDLASKTRVEPEEVAEVAAFFCTRAADAITAQGLTVGQASSF